LGWRYIEVARNHDAIISASDEICDILEQIAADHRSRGITRENTSMSKPIPVSTPALPAVAEPRVLRVYCDERGETHLETLTLTGEIRCSEVSSSVAWWSERISTKAVIWRRVIEEAPSTEPHCAPRRQIMVPLSGAVEIEVSSGDRQIIEAGSLILVEDTWGKGHITRAVDGQVRVTLTLELDEQSLPASKNAD
jgi:hypothetical protein